jgi:hypothetical protein
MSRYDTSLSAHMHIHIHNQNALVLTHSYVEHTTRLTLSALRHDRPLHTTLASFPTDRRIHAGTSASLELD